MEVADLRKQIEILTDRSKLEQTRIEARLQVWSASYCVCVVCVHLVWGCA